ncbi:uncharacterized protein A1O5_09383 [Cladophialophora psammophila CBS 110553]|uniref:Uncharacterized protein n=1 Tax=Cladophialophora psammophila CBS 110553 TaxID=1182543 RepID=W9WQY2_9EURO|nr:uncharacterized protein A1O5_09383 [Cladophialophora psammophila CBS 110553]EXJ67370.1 hypothetical protein A1O5_09383 [Cladophialophora psammophila CBS 110553]
MAFHWEGHHLIASGRTKPDLFFTETAAAICIMSHSVPPKSSSTATSITTDTSHLEDRIALLSSLVREHSGNMKLDQDTNLVDAGLDSLLGIELVNDILSPNHRKPSAQWYETGFSGFWKQIYPLQSRLALAYVVEAFEKLGCTSNSFSGFCEFSGTAGCLFQTGNNLIRTETEIDKQSSGAVYENILVKYPQHGLEHKLLRVAGSQLAECLRGAYDASQLPVRNTENRELLDLEIGGGGGAGGGAGTIQTIIGLHDRSKVSYTYTFTDKSPSRVAEVRRQFQSNASMKFMALNVDEPAPTELLGKFHTVKSAHGVQATRNLEQSLGTIRNMLREDGFLVLVELTRNMYWFDLVFGLFDDGSWLFHDDGGGRQQHVPVDERTWQRDLRKAGFKHVSWTDGASEGSRTLRIITGFVRHAENAKFVPSPSPRPKSRIENLVWSQVEDVLLYADVYLPDENEPDGKARPIASLIHGGGHVMFTRKDLGPKLIPLLLEKGFQPISVEYRFCPELTLNEGPMNDDSDALGRARHKVPRLKFFKSSQVVPDGNRVVAIGRSTGGHLAMTLPYTPPCKRHQTSRFCAGTLWADRLRVRL